ncbi:FAD/NAD(P)-binding domain-containing protein [Corynespora cassiicola Philippines]|uniref:FAD/NAD(P)-binding domain-containing protein n=1 Tax=Corynespora cassiicola Philippines TaxID=1448308 RepID=A0A2T2NSL3_CORCC|nr:FAD/NAD(P)-binding domain-containing protein [Corynespora cassiicola Philippines]
MKSVIIVGAGPSGLLLALNLARKGIQVRVLELSAELDNQPRATHYGPAAVHELRRSGILEEIQKQALMPNSVVWRDSDGNVLAELPQSAVASKDRVVSLPLNSVVKILYDAVCAQPTARVDFSHTVTEVSQDDDEAWVRVRTEPHEQDVKISASYIVGCDGASSIVRHSLFESEFPGFTWDLWLVATNVRFGGFSHAGWSDINFVIHPTDWFMAARLGGPDNLWRITYPEDAKLSREECAARVVDRLRSILPGHPGPDQFEVVNSSPYRVHQRCAPRFRSGRILLAADAAHLCNPMGGMGLTSGIVDVGGLSDCFIGIHQESATHEILEKYAEVRRNTYRDIVDPITTTNLKRLMMEPKQALATDPFLQACRSAKDSPEAAGKLAQSMRAAALLKHDFTQYYTTSSSISS